MKAKVSCPRCTQDFDVDGEPGSYAIKCPTCGHGFSILIEPGKSVAASPDAAGAAAAPRSNGMQASSFTSDPSTRNPRKPASPAARPTYNEYMIDVEGRKSGPHTAVALLSLRRQGKLPDSTRLIYPHEDWSQATELKNSHKVLGDLRFLRDRSEEHCDLPGDVDHSSDLHISRRSGWATAMKFIGFASLVFGGLGSLSLFGNEYIMSSVIVVGFGVTCIFQAFLLDVFTDIRWLLKKLVDKTK